MYRRLLLPVALAIVITAGVIALIGQAADFDKLVHGLERAELSWLVVCALGQVLAYLGYIVSYQAIARLAGGPRLPLGIVLRVVGLAFGAFSVATTVGGLAVDFWALRETGEPAANASARVIALETLRWAVLSLATCAGCVLLLAGLADRPPWGVAAAWLLITPACFLAGRWFSAPERRGRFTAPERRQRFTAPERVLRGAPAIAIRALVYLRQLIHAPPALRARAIVGAAVYWTGDLLCAWAALRAFGVRIGVLPLLVGYSTGLLSEMLPLPAGGAGGVDAALTGGFALAGVPLPSALLAAVTFRLFTFWLPMVLALASVLTVGSLRRRLKQIAAARGAEAAT